MNKAQRLLRTIGKASRRVIGLMSGMSMDGVDLACADISGEFPNLQVDLVGTHYRAFSKEFRSRLSKAQSAAEISTLNFLVAQEFANCVEEFLSKGFTRNEIDAIGSHGQTLFHSSGGVERSTLQIGAPSIIAELTGIATIGNFRVRDIAAGGRGAPLVSIADYVLFREPSGPVALNNLGSISNVTIVTPEIADMLAFDTGPANMPIDFFAARVPGNHCALDLNGQISARGQIMQSLLVELLRSPFFSEPPPKAAGYDEFGPRRLTELSRQHLAKIPEDYVRTAVEFSAITIGEAYRRFVLPRYPSLRQVSLSGGGIYNKTLVHRIGELLPELAFKTFKSDFSDAKEALAFAILANETLSGRCGSFSATTGVVQPTPLGEIAI